MRHAALVLVLGSIAAAAFGVVACSSSGGGSGTTTGTGGNKTTSSSSGSTSSGMSTSSSSSGTGGSTSSSSSSSSGTGGQVQAPSWLCTGVPATPPSSGACVGFTPPDGGVEGDAGLDSNGNASNTTCNPVTNAGCTGTDVCTYDASFMYYYCAPAGSPAGIALCGDCTADTATCGPDMICVQTSSSAAQCIQTCCTDADCGSTGKCALDALTNPAPMNVGLCVSK